MRAPRSTGNRRSRGGHARTPSAQLRPPIPWIQPLGPQIRSPPRGSSHHRACRTVVRSSPRGGEASPDQPPPDPADEHADPATPALKRQTATTKQVDRSNCSHREEEGERGCERAAVAAPLRRKGGGGARGERRGGRGGRLWRPLARSRQPPSPWPLLASGGGESVEEREREGRGREAGEYFFYCALQYIARGICRGGW